MRKKNNVLKGSRLAYNAAQQARYVSALERLVRKMTTETNRQIKKLFNGEVSDEFFKSQAMDASIASQARILLNALSRTFDNLFNLKASILAEAMVRGAEKTSATTVGKSLKELSSDLTLKTSVVSAGQEEVAKALISENVSLIKSIPEQYLKNVTGSVMRSITTGRGLSGLVPDLQKYQGQTQRRAKLLALDQTRKAYNSINRQKLMANGIREFIWQHSGGGLHPRESHIKLDGMTFSFENLEKQQAALGVPEKDRSFPGVAINCRCTLSPVIVFEAE